MQVPVHGAMLLGCARKYVSQFNHAAGSPITSLQYLSGILLEAGEMEVDLNYWRHLADRLHKMETHWRAHAKFARRRQSYTNRNDFEAISKLRSIFLDR